jgi:2'-5' RNA ligase
MVPVDDGVDVAPDESALLVPVPALDALVHQWRIQLDPSAQRGVPAHVTVLYPFVPANRIDDDVVGTLRALFASCPSFAFAVAGVDWFGDTVAYLRIAPPEPFVELTAAVGRAYPDYPPYGGEHAEVVPHLTLGMGPDTDALRRAAAAVAPSLPIGATAGEVWLMTGGANTRTWRLHTAFALA